MKESANHSHAWRGSWDRPMLLDEDSLHPFTVARMTDHNVRGVDSLIDSNDDDDWEIEYESDTFAFGF